MSFSCEPISVSRLVELLKEVTEDNFSQVIVQGEIANFSAPASGHWYFTLKDDRSQMQAVMFRPQNRLVAFRPEAGMEVLVRGRMTIYSQRGNLQLMADRLEPCGVGGLQLAFEQLKTRLEAEGLFAAERKQALPAYPRTIGIVTSATGAALHDILTVLRRRAAGVRVILRSSLVQGETAAADIARGIDELNRQGQADVLIVGRGGGSLEDLWAFNEEPVVRAIAASSIPVISAVGHEVDTTLADYAADLRAPTPSAAAELVAKNRFELEGHVDHLIQRLSAHVTARLHLQQQRLEGLTRRLRTPQEALRIATFQLDGLQARLIDAVDSLCQQPGMKLAHLSARLQTLSPLNTLSRGYAIAFKDGVAVSDCHTLQPNDQLQIRVANGEAEATVTGVKSCDD